MGKTTQEERDELRRELAAHSDHRMNAIIGKAVNDADRLAMIERRVIYWTPDMPTYAKNWARAPNGECFYLDEQGASYDRAPDFRPGESGPLFLPIIHTPEHDQPDSGESSDG